MKETFEVEILYHKEHEVYAWVSGKTLYFRLPKKEEEKKESSVGEEIRTMMPGRVVKVHVKPGDLVEADAPLVVLEAMKMENEIKASGAGTVAEILVQEGMSVESDALLIRMEKKA